MNRVQSAWGAYALLALGYCLYATFTETGLVGWVNLAQQAVFGAYSLKMSLLLSVLLLLIAGALVWAPRRYAQPAFGKSVSSRCMTP